MMFERDPTIIIHGMKTDLAALEKKNAKLRLRLAQKNRTINSLLERYKK